MVCVYHFITQQLLRYYVQLGTGLHSVLAATTGSCLILHQSSLKMEVKIKPHPLLHTAALGRRHPLSS